MSRRDRHAAVRAGNVRGALLSAADAARGGIGRDGPSGSAAERGGADGAAGVGAASGSSPNGAGRDGGRVRDEFHATPPLDAVLTGGARRARSARRTPGNIRSVSSEPDAVQPNFRASVQSIPMRAIPVSWCVGGRDLSEPRLRPDGTAIAWAVSEQGDTSIVLALLDETSADLRQPSTTRLTSGPAPRVGRGLGGGCWCWAGPEAIVYAAVDGNLWWQPLADEPARQLTDHGPERVAQAPCATRTGVAWSTWSTSRRCGV